VSHNFAMIPRLGQIGLPFNVPWIFILLQDYVMRAISSIIIYLIGSEFSCFTVARAFCQYVLGVSRELTVMSSRCIGKEPWEISQTVSWSAWMLRYQWNDMPYYTPQANTTYIIRIYIVLYLLYIQFSKLKFYFCLWQKKSTDLLQLFSFCTDDNSSHINNKFSLSSYFKILLYFIVLFRITTLKDY